MEIARVQFRHPPSSQVGANWEVFDPVLMFPLSKLAKFLTKKRKSV